MFTGKTYKERHYGEMLTRLRLIYNNDGFYRISGKKFRRPKFERHVPDENRGGKVFALPLSFVRWPDGVSKQMARYR